MKIRIFQNLDNSVFRVVINTEDFGQDDIKLMCQYGEPEIESGGEISYEYNNESKTKTLGVQMIRVLHGFPLAFGFDSRDYGGSCAEAEAVGRAWKDKVISDIGEKMRLLRLNSNALPTEEVVDGV